MQRSCHWNLQAALQNLLSDGETPESLAQMLCKSSVYVHKALTIGRKLSSEAKRVIEGATQHFTSIDLLYDVAQIPVDRQETLLLRVKNEGLNRAQVREITAPIKAQEKAERGARRGRKPAARSSMRRIPVPCGALVTVSFRKAGASENDVQIALEQALNAVKKDTEPVA